VIPIYNATRQVKRKMSQMEEQLRENQRDAYNRPQSEAPKKNPPSSSEYIDYEEVK
jgi:hypothetical protein